MTRPAPGQGLRRAILCSLWLPFASWAAPAADAAAEVAEQKIIFIRHAEKPARGLGMINCQGLNRALALPAVLLARFGKPDFVFAPDPHEKKVDGDQSYNYVRPLLTVAPTAVQLGLPIDTSFGYENIQGLQQELAAPRYQNAVVLVAWEHRLLEEMVRAMLQRMGGQASAVPHWKSSDFDSIYVLTVRRSQGQARASFALEQQALNGQSPGCAATP
ncbi:histidine phosphatase family protein [Polaromonas jejuensis]|uniref:Histidine phosphatase family protein n=2 Tax=Polaromonas jejuensis TaxID=457502 RepID=A0ABW0Q703_9BURK|nr:histidine phosphatase family protein [Polaromonas jejuensis]